MDSRKTVLFFSLNSPGHINSALGIADRLKDDYNFRTVFLLLGDMMGTSVRDHGHELVTYEEKNPLQDYEILEGDDPMAPVDEELMRQLGREKKKFSGVFKWPQLISRMKWMLELEPLEAFIRSLPYMEQYMVAELLDNHDNIQKALDTVKPDLVVVDAYYIPPCIVNLKHIPWVRLFSANPLAVVKPKLAGGIRPPLFTGAQIYTKHERERLRQEDPSKWQSMLDEWTKCKQRVEAALGKVEGPLAAFMAQHGCPPLRPGQQAHDSPHINLYMFPKAIDYDQDDDLFEYPPEWFRCDSLVRKDVGAAKSVGAQGWLQKLDDAKKAGNQCVFFSLGSLASGDWKRMKEFVDMFSTDTKRLYVISKGANGDKYELNPSNMIGGNYIPQTFFLERVDLAIIHGGNNSITECLYYGRPMIVVPAFADQIDNAQRVEDLKLGKRIDPKTFTREQLMQAIDDILSDGELIERVRQIGEEMQARDDARKVSYLLNKLTREGKLEREFLDECRDKRVEEI